MENLKEKFTDLLSLFYIEEIDQDEAVDKILIAVKTNNMVCNTCYWRTKEDIEKCMNCIEYKNYE